MAFLVNLGNGSRTKLVGDGREGGVEGSKVKGKKKKRKRHIWGVWFLTERGKAGVRSKVREDKKKGKRQKEEEKDLESVVTDRGIES